VSKIEQSIERFTLKVALCISLLLAVLAPTGYYLISYQYLRGVLDVQSELSADAVSGVVRSNPALWRFEELRLTEILERATGDNIAETRRVLDINGAVIAKNSIDVPPPRLTRVHNIYDAGSIVARIEVSRSLDHLLQLTVVVALFSIIIAGGVFFVLRTLPLSALKKAYRALGESEKKYRSLYETMKEGMLLHQVTFDDNQALESMCVIDVNPAGAAIFGDNRAVVGSDSLLLLGDTLKEYFPELQSMIKNQSSFSFELTPPGMKKLFVVQAFSPDEGLIATLFEDITDRRQSEQQIQKMAYFDSLTGLPNRSLFLDRLNQAMARASREKGSLALLFLDLDRFKNVNDTLGHSVGDQLLTDVSMRLKRHIRNSDTLARLGGDEFVVIATNLGKELNATYVAKNLIEAVQAPFRIGNDRLHVTTSIGIALFPEDGTDTEALLKNADLAMYSAKESGRNAFSFYSPEMNRNAHLRMELEAGLRSALIREEFFLEFQPIINAADTRIVAAEALVRWKHPTRGRIPPDEFIPLAEETGLILPLGEWVLRTACSKIKAWSDAGLPQIRIAVNVSSRQVEQQNFAGIVRNVLLETGANASQLELELTESCLVNHAGPNIAEVFGLREWGISISIDDFGTGYSSLGYIKALPIDHIKIDKSFVNDIGTKFKDQAIVEAVIAMSQKLGIQNIAEGVENLEQLKVLKEQGCDEIQGYYFHRPLPAEALEKLLREQGNSPEL
jgi:diguanylate cyclase (GGDEF)-like protein